MSESAKIGFFMSLQWLLLAAFLIAVLLTPAASRSLARDLAAGLLAVGGLVVGAVAIAAHRRKNHSYLINPSPRPRDDAELITGGIYRWIRHPLYLSVILLLWGVALYHAQWLNFALAAVIALFYAVKLRFEESLLSKKFPHYTEYRKSAGALTPRIFKCKGK
jgi:protein-S-isoprenylcysteine O-methyltransferase Ste14